MTIEGRVLRELHRVALEADRPGISVPSIDLDALVGRVGDRPAVEQALTRLARSGSVVRVRRDLLVLPDSTGLLNVEMDALIDVAAPAPYLITGGAALEHFELTDQHFFSVSVLVPNEVSALRYRGQVAKFFRTTPANIWGAESGARFALPERALVDVINHPRYGVSLTQALDALLLATSNDPSFLDRLLMAVTRYSAGPRGHSSRSAARRVGLIVERLFGPASAAPYRDLIGSNRAAVPLRPGRPPTGVVDHTWRVAVNAVLEPETAR